MRALRILIALLATCFLGLVVVALAAADEPSTTLAVTPATLALAPGESAHVLVVASNPFTTVQSITLSAIDHRGLSVTIAEPKVVKPARGEVAWQVTVTRQAPDVSPEPLQFRADCDQQETDGTQVHSVKTAALEVASRAPDPLETALKIELRSGWETIEDSKERQVFVVATNTLQVPLTITGITVVPYADVTPKASGLGPSGYGLQPHEARPFTISLTTGNQVEPGPRLLIVTVDAAWEQAGQRATGSVVLSHPFQVGVYGESAILAATKIPSLLLLPGFLFLTAILLLRKLFRQQPAGEQELDFTKPPFWFLGITLSLLATLFYPIFTRMLAGWKVRVLGQQIGSRNLIQAYGFVDILLLWLGAALLGALVWALVSTVCWGWRHLRAWHSAWQARKEADQRRPYIPDPDDDPLETLRKIGRNEKRLGDLGYSRTVDGQESPVWQLPTRYPTQGKEWVMPTMEVTWRKTDPEAKSEIDRLMGGEVSRLVEAIERYAAPPDDPVLKLIWKSTAQVTGVLLADSDRLHLAKAPTGESPLRLGS